MFLILEPGELAISIDSDKEVNVDEAGRFFRGSNGCELILHKNILSERWIIKSV